MTRLAKRQSMQASPRTRKDTPSDNARDKQRLLLWLKLLRTSRAIEVELRSRLRQQFDVTLPHFDVMAALARKGADMTMTELSRCLIVSNGNVTSIVDAMVEAGCVVRRPKAHDRRATVVQLTPAGQRDFAVMAAAHKDWIDELFRGVEPEVAAHMSTMLNGLEINPTRRTSEGVV